MTRLCDDCEECLPTRAYRGFDGKLYEWCDECAKRIARTSHAPYHLVGPADNLEARVEWAKRLVRLGVNDMLEAHELPEIVRLLSGAIELPHEVIAATDEVMEARESLPVPISA